MSEKAKQVLRSTRFQDLLEKVGRGDRDATDALVQEYGRHILRAVRRRMNVRVRDRYDSEDFTQAVWASFFGHISVIQRIESEAELIGVLSTMAFQKVIDAGRRTRVRSEHNQVASDNFHQVTIDRRLGTRTPTPSQFAVADEHWQKLIARRGDRSLTMLEMRRAGSTQAEIAATMGMSERHVRRILERITRKNSEKTD